MSRYGKYFLQHILWLDDGFCKYYIQDRALCPQDILDVPCIIFDIRHEAESLLIQCARHDAGTTLKRLRSFLATECLDPLPVQRLDDRQVIQAAARRLTTRVHKIVIEPRYGWAVQYGGAGAEPLVPVRVEPEPDLDRLIRRLQSALGALVAEQQQKYDRHEARLAAMTSAQRTAAYGKKAGSGLYEGTIGSIVGLAKLAGSFTLGYWKTLWSLANYPNRAARLTVQAMAASDMTPIQQEIDRLVTPVAQTCEQAAHYKAMLQVLFSDPELTEILYDFAHRYWKATHPLDRTELGAEALSDVVLTLLLLLLTAGTGAIAHITAKSARFARAGEQLHKILAVLKRVGPRQKVPSARTAAADVQVQPRASSVTGMKAKPLPEKHFKRKHIEGDPKDPYTLMPDGKPMGAEVGKVRGNLKGLDDLPENHEKYVRDGWPSLDVEYAAGRHTRDYRNFTDAKPDTLKPGTKIYRIIDDQSTEFKDGISGSYWTTEMPKDKTQWRRDYAVKDSWNDNGYYIEETVGSDGLKVWRGETAAQEYKESDFFLRGGKEQIFVQRGGIDNYAPKLTNWPEL